MHPACLPPETLLAACDERRLRRSGPGGQHRNKVETAVVLTHPPTGVSAEANERRSQQQNREMALDRLRVRLAVEVREPVGEPTSLWRSRVRGGRLVVSPTHADFAALLSEALDHAVAVDWDDAAAAERLGVSRSQFVRFVALAPAAWELLNRQRAERGLKRLRAT